MKYPYINKSQKGVAAIEVALVMPFIFLMMLGGIDLARTMYQYNTLVKNLRDATKYVSSTVRPIGYGDANSSDPEVAKYRNIVEEAKNLAVCGSTTGCTSSSVDNLLSRDINIFYLKDGTTDLTFVKMSVCSFSLGFVSNLFGESLNLKDISYTMYQRQQSSTPDGELEECP